VEIVAAIYRSAKQRRPVRLPLEDAAPALFTS